MVDCYRAIHSGGANFDFGVVDRQKGLLICRDIKVSGKNAVGGRRRELARLLAWRFGSRCPGSRKSSFDKALRRSGDFDFCEALVDSVLADLDLADLKCRPLGQNLIQHFGQD